MQKTNRPTQKSNTKTLISFAVLIVIILLLISFASE